MKAAYYESFKGPVVVTQLPDPSPGTDGVVIRVEATGLCLSDWHGWQGHDSGISLPHVPGHELAGVVMETGKNVGHWRRDDRVTLPFVNGCGGVGLSTIMIANALGAQVVAVDINEQSLHLAKSVGALATVNASTCHAVVDAVKTLSGGGVHLSVDALGNRATCYNSIANLRKRGRHLQIGLLADDDARALVPMDLVVARELKIIGSHGMQAFRYEALLEMIGRGKLAPQRLITRTIPLAQAPLALMSMGDFQHPGVTVIDSL